MFTHCGESPLGAGPLVSGLDRHPVACSRGIEAGGELSRRAEVQQGLTNRRRRVGRDRKRCRMGWRQRYRFEGCRFGDGGE